MLLLAGVLIVEYVIRRRNLAKESARNAQKQQQLAALASELKDLKGQLARTREIAEKLPQFARKVTERLPEDAYPPIAVRFAKEFFHADKVGYFAPVGLNSDYGLVVGAGFPDDWPKKVRIHCDEGMVGLALQKKMVISRTDPNASSGRRPGQRSSRKCIEDHGITPDFVAPVFGISGVVGALVIAGCPLPLDGERAYLSTVTDLLSTMLQKAALLDSRQNGGWVDHLTGVANRSYFAQRFESEIRRAMNYGQAMALFMFDVDEFKTINDTYGHHAGDVVIKKMAELVKLNTRSSDLVARFGGDEFMVLMTSTTEEQATYFAEKLREKIASTEIVVRGTKAPLRITISGGLAMFPAHGRSTTELLQTADDALYDSKRQGRNRIRVATVVGLGREPVGEADANGGTQRQHQA